MFQENLRLKRKERGLSQEELASRLHVVRQTISKWEKGQSVPDAEQLIKLAVILETTVSELLGTQVENEEESTQLAKELSLPLYVKENTLLATGAVNDRPDYDYRDGATLHLYELADGASCTCRMVDVKGADVCAITAERKGGVYSFKADGDMKGLTVILHGICAEGVKAENAQIHTDSVSGCVSAAIGTSTREVKITVE